MVQRIRKRFSLKKKHVPLYHLNVLMKLKNVCFTSFICVNIILFDSVVGKEIETFLLVFVFLFNSVDVFLKIETCSIKCRIA